MRIYQNLLCLEIELASLENRPINPELMKTLRKETPQFIEPPLKVEEVKTK